MYQQNEDGITGEEVTYSADEGQEAWSEKKNIKYDKYGREEWEYVFRIEDGVENISKRTEYEYQNFEVSVLQDSPQKSIEIQGEQKNTANGIYVPVKYINFLADGAEGFWEEYSYEKKMDKLSGQEKCILKIQMETRNV